MSPIRIVTGIALALFLAGCASEPQRNEVAREKARLVAVEQQKLQVGDLAPFDGLGTSVALLGDTAVLGDPSDDDGPNSQAGSIRVFARSGSTWALQQTVMAPGESCLHLGAAV